MNKKIEKETGLKPKEIKFYEAFYMHTGLNDNVIMADDAKFLINKFENDNETPEEYNSPEEKYDYWLNRFKDKGLIHKIECFYGDENIGASYPILKGYNPINDPEFYIPYRTKGEEKWNGRMYIEEYLKNKDIYEINYEFDLKEYRKIRRQKIKEAIQDARDKDLIDLAEHLTSNLDIWDKE